MHHHDWLYISSMLANIASLKPRSELSIILDSHSIADSQLALLQEQVIRQLHELYISFNLFDTEALRQMQHEIPPEECPIFDILAEGTIPGNEMADWLIPLRMYHRSLVIWTQSMERLDAIYSVLNNTIQQCNLAVDAGIFHDNTRIYFFVGSNVELGLGIFHGRERLRRHSNVAAIVQINSTEGHFTSLFLHNAAFAERERLVVPRVSHVWTPTSTIRSLDQAFANHGDLLGTTVIATTMPYPPFIFADEVDDGPVSMFTNYWGMWKVLLGTICSHLNCTVEWQSPTDSSGIEISNGSYIGYLGQVVYGEADLVIMYNYYSLSKAGKYSVPHYWDFVTLCSPKAGTRERTMAILDPFRPLVWALFLSSTFTISSLMYAVTKIQEEIDQKEPWDTSLLSIYWLVLQYITSQKDLVHKLHGNSLRCIVITWLFCCFLMSIAYNGQIKGFLTLPVSLPEVCDLAGILKSGFPWFFPEFGTLEERIMATSSDPVVSSVWNHKTDADKLWESYRMPAFSMDSYILEVQLVYERKFVVIDWYTFLESIIRACFSTRDGRSLVHLKRTPILNRQSALSAYTNAFTPWQKSLDGVTRRIVETGLIDKFLEDTYRQLREVQVSSGWRDIVTVERPALSPMVPSDFRSACFVYCIMIVAAMVFLLEVISARVKLPFRTKSMLTNA